MNISTLRFFDTLNVCFITEMTANDENKITIRIANEFLKQTNNIRES